jgi:uncharacterized FlaG/YvyC family protein
MQIGVNNINTEQIFKLMLNHLEANKKSAKNAETLSFEQIKQIFKKDNNGNEFELVQQSLDKIKELTKSIDQEVRLSVNKDINRIIISVVEKSSGRLITEYPCDELQKLALSLKRVIDTLTEEKMKKQPHI